ncbi:hypothetical protein [Erythrobacter sp.]|uniref:hypothetical protein n=1 Tax=Erythrobacter sp. TaxID=1042 RepID=UPI0025E32D10|nr:hypothetical protein [Erythrobacter sp.]
MIAVWAGAFFAVAASGAPAAAQYREGTPEVLAAPARAPNMRAAQETRSADDYRRAGSPRIVVFWNRELSDRIANDYDTVLTDRGETAVDTAAEVSRNGRYAEGALVTTRDREVRLGRREVEDDRRDSLLDESREWELLEAFQSRLQSNGLVLVDRSLAVRAIAAAEGGPADKQTAEMRGIAGLADLMMTLTQTGAPDAPLGIRFKITVTDLDSGQIVTTLVAEGEGPPRGPGRFVAGANGFEREQPPALDAAQAGANLASDLMMRLAGKW